MRFLNDPNPRRQEWRTPASLFQPLNNIFGFTIDAAASAENALLPRYWTKEQDALAQDWSQEIVYVNPPFKQAKAFLAKGNQAKAAAIILMANSLTTSYFGAADVPLVLIPPQRIKFISDTLRHTGSPTFGSVVAIFGASEDQQQKLSGLGWKSYSLCA